METLTDAPTMQAIGLAFVLLAAGIFSRMMRTREREERDRRITRRIAEQEFERIGRQL